MMSLLLQFIDAPLRMLHQTGSWMIPAVLAGGLFLWLLARNDQKAWWAASFSSIWYSGCCLAFGWWVQALWGIVYLGISIYGWWHWPSLGKSFQVWSLQEHLMYLGSGLLLFAILVIVGFQLHDAILFYVHSYISLAAVVALWLSSQKLLGSWIYWVLIGTIGVFAHAFVGNYLSAVVMAVFVFVGVYGYIRWLEEWKESNGEHLWARGQL
ncbi:nicotinamide mononucleotide transporter family protein [Persicobacter sp. CCB-QB2]|uniref:nicotinamide mononucleotide transporter family protein n=1 Tax=Persicobacter sp. CCB-QB2 TaxID=1561025 RepID=UPI0009E3CB22|nr:nicotinamide mononucleotide transporter family protein [Persicobacter sp. CCB-QB2]